MISGPLELVAKNILQEDDSSLEQALKDGAIQYKPTKQGLPIKHVDVPQTYTVIENDCDSPGSSFEQQHHLIHLNPDCFHL